MNDMPRVTQEMIDLYDHFTHVSTDKAAYLDKLTALVGSRAAAEAITSQIAANKMSAPLAAVNDPRLTIEKVTFDENMTGYLAMPKGASRKLLWKLVKNTMVFYRWTIWRRMSLLVRIPSQWITTAYGSIRHHHRHRALPCCWRCSTSKHMNAYMVDP